MRGPRGAVLLTVYVHQVANLFTLTCTEAKNKSKNCFIKKEEEKKKSPNANTANICLFFCHHKLQRYSILHYAQ